MFSINRHRAHTGTTVRKGRRGRVLAATVLAGGLTAGLVGMAAPADAATTIVTCPPASVQFTAIAHTIIPTQLVFITTWQASYNGVTYYGVTEGYHHVAITPPNRLPAPNQAGYCYLVS